VADTEPDWIPPDYSGTACPTLEEGANDGFVSGDDEREFLLYLPDDPAGAPVVFVWHEMGGSASGLARYAGFDDLATDEGVVLVAPESDGSTQYEWHYSSPAEGNTDLVLFDDVVSCLYEQYAVDLGAIYATGMSAGGMWTSYMTLYRADILAATAPFSGGWMQSWYESPEEQIPVMLTWGGSSDTFSTFSFEEASLDLSESLGDDGHFVVECDHGGGHTMPTGAAALAWQFFLDHPKGVDPEPYADGLPSEFPDYCSIPQ
jgi:poly(3-hydroxybutyrate) depolymerase